MLHSNWGGTDGRQERRRAKLSPNATGRLQSYSGKCIRASRATPTACSERTWEPCLSPGYFSINIEELTRKLLLAEQGEPDRHPRRLRRR